MRRRAMAGGRAVQAVAAVKDVTTDVGQFSAAPKDILIRIIHGHFLEDNCAGGGRLGHMLIILAV
jgi:hypothetical protein